MLSESVRDEVLGILTKQVPNVKAARAATTPDTQIPESVAPDKLGIDAPLVIPEGERDAYVAMHSLRPKFAKQLQARWNQFKREYLATLNKALNTTQKNVFEDMLNDFNDIALKAFQQGVDTGNSYFENQFKINGLNNKQQSQLVNKHLSIFEDKSYNLFYKEAASALDGQPPENHKSILDGYDKFLLNYANVAVGIAYDTFTRGISLLNKSIGAAFKIGGLGLPTDPVKVIWVLAEDAHHSIDCDAMAMGVEGDGSGIWDARQLAEMGLMPASSLLDCGGNCRCHLSAYVPLDTNSASWLNVMTESAPIRNVLKVQPNLSISALRKLLSAEGVTLNVADEEIFTSILANPLLRRNELWRDLNSFTLNTIEGEAFAVDGLTSVMNRGKLGKLPDTLQLTVTLPKGITFNELTQFQKDEIQRVAAHEFGHTIAFPLKSTVTSNVLDRAAAAELLDAAGIQLDVAVARINANFDNAVRAMAKSTITAEMKTDISVMKTFLANPQNLIESIFEAIQKKEPFGNVTGRQAWAMVEQTIAQYSPGTRLVTAYQLRNSNEYLAEWLSILFTNPERAAVLDPTLNRLMSKLLPEFFDSAAVRRASALLPDSLALAFRLDAPTPGGLTPVSPNTKELQLLAESALSKTKRITTAAIREDFLGVIESNPLLQRSEYFKNLKINFVDRVQMGKMSGSKNNIGFLDKGIFTVNLDYWDTLTGIQKQATVSDMIADHLWQTFKPLMKTEIRAAYSKDVLGRVLEYVQSKAGIQRLGTRMVAEIKAIALGVGENRGDLSFWTRNYNQYFLPVLKNIPDLPIMNFDSLASPKDFWMSWFRLYVTQPGYAAYYSRDLFEILGANLTLGTPITKFLSLRKILKWH